MPLADALVSTDAMDRAFSDAAMLAAMLRFETALARAEARHGLIPPAAADAIAAVPVDVFDVASIARGARSAATPAIAFVDALTRAVAAGDAPSAAFVHRGATSQDVTDTALVLCLRPARRALDDSHARIAGALRRLAGDHASTVMLARTLLQPAPPTTFGLKAAGWAASIARSQIDLARAFDGACILQFGGASGTLAALGARGLDIATELARELDLPLPIAPWHAHRDRLAALVCACAIYAGALAKAARDISLLMQAEVAEVSEPGGGSSTMPHKKNPAGCVVALAAASRLPGLAATMLAGLPQEHERSTGGSQAEWATVTAAVSATGAAAESMAGVVEGLHVDPERMRQSMEATRGTILAERAMTMLSGPLGRDAAARLVKDAVAAAARGSRFADALLASPEAATLFSPDEKAALASPEAYLGSAETFRRRLLDSIA